MLKDFVSMLNNRLEKEAVLVDACKQEWERRRKFNAEIKESFESIGADVPGFDNDDPIL